jgi:hypothetical protein
MPITARLDELGKPAWIVLVVLGFVIWWPLGLAALAFSIGSGRMGCGMHGCGRWEDRWQRKMEHMQSKMDWMKSRIGGGGPGGNSWRGPSSGNAAFDEYRNDTIKRLEEEQREFRDFLERLRFAKDKTEFDAFMAERKNRASSDKPSPQN